MGSAGRQLHRFANQAVYRDAGAFAKKFKKNVYQHLHLTYHLHFAHMTTVVAAVIERESQLLICRRRADQAHPLKWEFAGGKVETDETPVCALARELEEELGIRAEIGPQIADYEYAYPARPPIRLIFFSVKSFAGQLENRVFAEIRWEKRERLSAYDFLEGDLGFIRMLAGNSPANPLFR